MPAQLSNKNDSDEAQRVGAGETAQQLHEREQQTRFDQDFNNLTSPEHMSKDGVGGDTGSSDAVRDAEENPAGTPSGGFYHPLPGGKKAVKTGQKNIFVKKGGIIGLILTIVVGGGIAGVTLLSPAGLFLELGNVFTNAFDDSSSALSIKANKLIALKVNGIKNAFDQSSDGKCNIKCQFGTVGETMKNNLESPTNGFQAEFGDRKFGGRYTIKSVTFPDGTKTSTAAEFSKAMKDPTRARDFNKVFNSKIKFFLNGSPFALSLKTKLGLDRSPKVKGSTKEEVDASLRKSVGATGNTAVDGNIATVDEKKTTISDKISAKLSPKIDKAGSVLGVACLAYDATRISVAVTKASKYAAFAAFAISFLAVKDQIMAGDADGTVVSTLGAQLTDSGSSATDSAAFKQAKYGDTASNDTGFSFSPSTGLATALAGIGGAIGVNATARAAAHTTCATVNNPGAVVVSCLPEIIAGLGAAGVGAIVTAVGCIGVNFVAGAVVGAGIGAALPLIIDAIAKGDLKLPDETTRGAAAGQVIGLGAESVLNGKSQTFGLAPATSAQDIVAYNQATLEDKNMQSAIAKLDAADEPLNVNNQYTFVGSLVSKLDLASYKNTSFFGALTHTLGIVPLSLASASSSLYAESGYPLGYDKSKVFKLGNDASLDGIGVPSDKNGFPTYVMSNDELNEDAYTAIDNLVASNDIDANGAVIDGSDYQKYQTYCGINRVDPMGETTGSISDDDYEWEVGAKCTEKSQHMSDIRVHTMNVNINDTIDGKYTATGAGDTPSSSAAAATATTATATDVAAQPLQPIYNISAGFGPRLKPCADCSTNHPAVDLAKDPKNIVKASGYSYINPILYMALFGVTIG
ncbi:MAG TPA: hypothetical protein VIM37_02580 [Candidatus Microsaccharimonas sp.]|jgi:hypothetical protein